MLIKYINANISSSLVIREPSSTLRKTSCSIYGEIEQAGFRFTNSNAFKEYCSKITNHSQNLCLLILLPEKKLEERSIKSNLKIVCSEIIIDNDFMRIHFVLSKSNTIITAWHTIAFYQNGLQRECNEKNLRFGLFLIARTFCFVWPALFDLHKRCGVRAYYLEGGPLLFKKRNAFIQFYQIRINAWKSYSLNLINSILI